MSKKSRSHRTRIDPNLLEAPLDMMTNDDEIEFDRLDEAFIDDEWWDDISDEERLSTRRKIERRRERRALQSELNDWDSLDDLRWR